MLRLLADENRNIHLVRGLLRRIPHLDFVRGQDVGLTGVPDDAVLGWAAAAGRVLVTHDIKTVPPAAYARIDAGTLMAGVIAIPWTAPIGPVLDDLLLIVEATQAEDWVGKVEYLPL
jgi:hypothetical protein